jgi:hypothetical protein
MGPRRNLLALLSVLGVLLLPISHAHPIWVWSLILGPWVVLGVWRAIRPPAPPEKVTIDAQGVTREVRGRASESVTWATLTSVDIVTTSGGPFADDFFFVLHGTGGEGCAVSSLLGVGLLERLQRLPRFDNAGVIRASGSTTDARFACWKGEPGEALVAAGPPAEQPAQSLRS